jgi:hypothetical protein
MKRVKEKANALTATKDHRKPRDADLLSDLDQLVLNRAHPPIATPVHDVFPCNNIPHEPNPHFLCRKKEIEEIRTHLDASRAKSQLRSFALYGNGGIGKTQTALSFAHEQVSKGVEAVLWIDCETGLSVARSFTHIAELLQLDGHSQDEYSKQNRLLVLRWLRVTRKIGKFNADMAVLTFFQFREILVNRHGQRRRPRYHPRLLADCISWRNPCDLTHEHREP